MIGNFVIVLALCLCIVVISFVAATIFEERRVSTWSFDDDKDRDISYEINYEELQRRIDTYESADREFQKRLDIAIREAILGKAMTRLGPTVCYRKNDNSRVRASNEIIGRRLPDPVRVHRKIIDYIAAVPCEGCQRWTAVYGADQEYSLEHSLALCYPNNFQCFNCKVINSIE